MVPAMALLLTATSVNAFTVLPHGGKASSMVTQRRPIPVTTLTATEPKTAVAESTTTTTAATKDSSDTSVTTSTKEEEEEEEEEEEMSETQKLMQQVKDAGVAGVVSYALWELGFWAFSVPVCVFGYREVTGHWPDFSNAEDMQKLGAEAFAFVNFARFAVPLRIGLALSTTPWIQENIIDRFGGDGNDDDEKKE